MPGSGKSTFGKYLAAELEYTFFELDQRIESAEKKTIAEIFTKKGEEYFRKIEAEQLRLLTEEKCVVSAGGGTPCFHQNLDWMNKTGFTVFLNPPIEVIAERVSKETHRPLMGRDVKQSLNDLFEKRIAIYKKARMESGLSEPRKILAELINLFSNKHQIKN